MTTYTFRGGIEVVEVKGEPLKDLQIKSKVTNNQFAPLSKMLGKEQMKKLQDTLSSIYDEYIKDEFRKMGYVLVKKEDD